MCNKRIQAHKVKAKATIRHGPYPGRQKFWPKILVKFRFFSESTFLVKDKISLKTYISYGVERKDDELKIKLTNLHLIEFPTPFLFSSNRIKNLKFSFRLIIYDSYVMNHIIKIVSKFKNMLHGIVSRKKLTFCQGTVFIKADS